MLAPFKNISIKKSTMKPTTPTPETMNTSEQLKAEAIKKAWIAEIGETNYNQDASFGIDSDGWIEHDSVDLNDIDEYYDVKEYRESKTVLIRPKSLSGIENNNGWIQCDEDSTFEPNWYWVKKKDGDEEIAFYAPHRDCFGGVDADIHVSDVTHFQLINKPQPPIF